MGTTGYEFLAGTDALSIDLEGWEQIERGYRALVRPRPTDFPTTAHRAKRTMLTEHVTADVTRLAKRAVRLAGRLDTAAGSPLSPLPDHWNHAGTVGAVRAVSESHARRWCCGGHEPADCRRCDLQLCARRAP